VAVATAEAVRTRAAGLRRPLVRGAQLLAVSSFAVTQPLLDVLGKNAEFFAVRGSPPRDIVLFALAVAFVLPAALLAVEIVVGAVSERAGAVCHLVFLAALGFLFALHALGELGVERTEAVFGGALVAGAGLAAAVARVPFVRSLVTVLAPAPLVFLGFFLFDSPASELVFPPDAEVRLAASDSTAPVVVLLLDELPTNSLLDERGEIDAGRYPSFARLAESSTWFRNSSTRSASTSVAVPALLTGNAPRSGTLPVFANYPDNLFTLLGGSHRLNVLEAQTRVCPAELCERRLEPARERFRSLFSDARVVYLYLVSPPALEDRLPAIDEAWADFTDDGGSGAPAEPKDRGGLPKFSAATFHLGRDEDFIRFIASVRRPEEPARPALDFLHALLPHGPWLRWPDGRESAAKNSRAPGRIGEHWRNAALARQAYQRHLLQLGYTDGLLGALLDRLHELDLWDRALVVVTADHGVSFRGGDMRRTPTATNLADLGFTPLFVKLPGQRTGRVSEKHVTTADLLPTIADALDVEVPWTVDGTSGFEPGDGPDVLRVGTVSAPFAEALEQRERALARQVDLVGTGAFDERFFALGPYAELVGEKVDALAVEAGAEGAARIEPPVSGLLAALPEDSSAVPSPITGVLTGEAAAGDALAVAVNGRIAAVCEAYRPSGGDVQFSALAPATAFRPGENRVRVFLVGGAPERPVLRELTVELEGR